MYIFFCFLISFFFPFLFLNWNRNCKFKDRNAIRPCCGLFCSSHLFSFVLSVWKYFRRQHKHLVSTGNRCRFDFCLVHYTYFYSFENHRWGLPNQAVHFQCWIRSFFMWLVTHLLISYPHYLPGIYFCSWRNTALNNANNTGIHSLYLVSLKILK